MTKATMLDAIDRLYRILSKLATENVLLHRQIERLKQRHDIHGDKK